MLSEKEKQQILVTIIEDYYNHNFFSKFKKIFNLLIGDKLNLNFNINSYAPTLLSLVIQKAPSYQLFEFFINKGADLNFIGDTFAFEDEESLKFEIENYSATRYQTCLDFANQKSADLLGNDFGFDVPNNKSLNMKDDNITLTKSEYLYLYNQSQYLFDVVNTERLIGFIKQIGAKTFEELEKDNKLLVKKYVKAI